MRICRLGLSGKGVKTKSTGRETQPVYSVVGKIWIISIANSDAAVALKGFRLRRLVRAEGDSDVLCWLFLLYGCSTDCTYEQGERSLIFRNELESILVIRVLAELISGSPGLSGRYILTYIG